MGSPPRSSKDMQYDWIKKHAQQIIGLRFVHSYVSCRMLNEKETVDHRAEEPVRNPTSPATQQVN